jgi:cellulose synthase/poly-beta-1,6-N-acetylglucosamine synthase-like glycosyltransferase
LTVKQCVTVLVPTYRRPADLRRCLAAVAAQQLAADEVLVVMRPDDTESLAVVEELARRWPQLRPVEVGAPGQVQALNSGLDAMTGDIVAITDDDAVPKPDWLGRIAAWFACDARIGGVGGRDWVHHGDRLEAGARRVVGKLEWYGRCVGNHHLGVGGAREVDFLKGANMSYRRAAIRSLRFDTRLRGSGAQVHNDLAFSLAVHRKGWKLIYDPEVAVDHYPAARFDEDGRAVVSDIACRNAAFNQALIICEALGAARGWVFLLWATAIGTRGAPGLLQLVRLYASEGRSALVRTRATLMGTAAGWRAATIC